jgi:hypothetical protein
MEIWKDIEGYTIYQVSTFGNVRNKDRNKLLKQKVEKTGYIRVSLCENQNRKYHSIHRLVAEAFIENHENKSQVDHKDDDKANNNVTNLQWATAEENMNKRQYVINAKCIYKTNDKNGYKIDYTSNGKKYCTTRKKLEDAEAILAEWRRLYPHKII